MNFISIRLDPRLPLVVPRFSRTYLYWACIVRIGPKKPYFALDRSFLPEITWVGHIARVDYIDPYNELYKYQVGP